MIIGHNDVRPGDNRPAGKPDECFYCNQKMGWQHKPGCVILQKSVVIRVTLQVVVDVPRDWKKDNIESKYNDSSWCASSFVGDLERWRERVDAIGEENAKAQGLYGSLGQCLCPVFEADFVRDATEDDHREMPVLIDPKDLEP